MVCAGLNIQYNFEWSSGGDAANCVIALIFFAILVAFPFFVVIFYNLQENYKLIKSGDSEFKARFGGLLRDLNFKRRGRWALVYPCAQMLRKLWLAYILVF